MEANITYDLLWQYQVVLLQQIDELRYKISQTSYQLDYVERVLTNNESPRIIRKRNKWTKTLAIRRLEALDIELRMTMQNLAHCQAQIWAAQFTVQQSMYCTDPNTYYDTSYGPQHVGQPQALEESQVLVDDICSPDHVEVFDLSHMPATPAEPMLAAMRLPPRPISSSRDSGFWEPPMYAQPFDSDLTTDTSAHVFSHGLAPTPSPARISSIDSAVLTSHTSTSATRSHSSVSSLNPTANTSSVKPAAKAVEPLCIVRSNPPPVLHGLDSARSPHYLSPHLTQSPNSVFLRDLMGRSPPMSTDPQLTTSPHSNFFRTLLHPSATPATPQPATMTAEHYGSLASAIEPDERPTHTRRHSEDAIEIVGDRLDGAHGRWMREDGGVARRRGSSLADVAVKMWYWSPAGLERVEEMVWPLTA